MVKATITPFFLDPGAPAERGRSHSAPSTSLSSSCPRAAPSALSSVVFPYIRRLDISDDMFARPQKNPLLTLKLSSILFLDSVVNDDLTRHPLYTIKTVGTSTVITRSDPWEGVSKTAEIKWPRTPPVKGKGKESDGILVHMAGDRWKSSEALLKSGSIVQWVIKFYVRKSPYSLLPPVHINLASPTTLIL